LTTDTAVAATSDDLPALARQARWQVIKTVTSSKAGHIGGPLSMMDLLVSLYFRQLNIRPDEPDWADRDRFVLSKGHAAIGLYSVLALRGYLDVDELPTFDKGGSRLQGHPDVTRLPGLDASTGSLGQGLSVGVGMALGAQLAGKSFHTWVMLGDGEIQEGMVWEAVQVAARYKLSNLTAIVDRNGLQQFGLPSSEETALTDRGDRRDPWFGVDLAAVFQAFGWRVVEINGHDFDQIASAYALAEAGDYTGRPTVILAHTVKGKGLSLAEGVHTWHSIVPSAEDFEKARQELEADELELLDAYTHAAGSGDNSRASAVTGDGNQTSAVTGASTNGVSA
jgi:transketolase